MKRLFTLFGAAFLFVAAPQVSMAQDVQTPPEAPQQFWQRGRGNREQMDPEKMAKRTADRLNEVVGLSEKQYKKILRFHRDMYEEQMEEGNFGGFGGPGMGGRRPDGMGPGMGGRPDGNGQRPRREMSEEQRAEMQARMQERMEEQRAAEQERHERIAKKYKKILTPEQYATWEKWEAEEAVKREMRMKEQQERRMDGDHRRGERRRRDNNDGNNGPDNLNNM
ncbi:MAG: hypothetical protein J5699_04075 [Bacteroidales bacterium]|nr:hypothetical protein [Bacteroidales bacterium]